MPIRFPAKSWGDQPHVAILPLYCLGRRDSTGIIKGVTQNKALPDNVVEHILLHTDGVPLFIEEFTRSLLESGLLRETTKSYVLDQPLPPLAVPTTLQASLVAHLDRLGSAKHVALIGAAIGMVVLPRIDCRGVRLGPDGSRGCA